MNRADVTSDYHGCEATVTVYMADGSEKPIGTFPNEVAALKQARTRLAFYRVDTVDGRVIEERAR